jgi:trans-aconitate methyltransferase
MQTFRQITVRLREAFAKGLEPENHILDLGALDGEIDKLLLEAVPTLHITAVDQLTDEELAKRIIRNQRFTSPQIAWVIGSVERYTDGLTDNTKFEGIFAQNIFQFLDKDQVLNRIIPRLQTTLRRNGQFAIRTFSAEPVPAFDTPMTSLYQLDDLAVLFPAMQWDVALAEATVFNSLSLRNDRRDFSIIDLLARKR